MRTDNFDTLWAELKSRIEDQRADLYPGQKSDTGGGSVSAIRFAKGSGGLYLYAGPLSGIMSMPREAIMNLAAQCLDVVARIDQDNTPADNG